MPTSKAQLLTASLSNLKPEELVSLRPKKPVFDSIASNQPARLNRKYRVKSGDNLTLIAKANKVNVKDLQHWNKLSGNNLKAGQILVMQDTRKSTGRKPTQYKVKKGDSLYIVAKRFNVEMQHLKRWNPSSAKALKPGQMLTVSKPR